MTKLETTRKHLKQAGLLKEAKPWWQDVREQVTKLPEYAMRQARPLWEDWGREIVPALVPDKVIEDQDLVNAMEEAGLFHKRGIPLWALLGGAGAAGLGGGYLLKKLFGGEKERRPLPQLPPPPPRFVPQPQSNSPLNLNLSPGESRSPLGPGRQIALTG